MRSGFVDRLRAGDLVSGEAARLAAAVTAAATLVVLARLLWFAPGLVESDGSPVAHDFSLFYAAGRLVRAEGVGAVYDLARLGAASKALFGTKAFVAVWPYPPPMAAAMAALASAPYTLALAVWTLVPTAALIFWVWRATGSGFATLLVAGSPVLMLNTLIGQAGPLFTLLLASGVLAAARGSAAGGLPVGLMVLKPHLAVLAPFAFAAGGHWRAFAVAAGVAVGLVALSVGVQGVEPWSAWLGAMREAARLAASADVDSRLPSVQAAARMLGAGAGFAGFVQAAVALVAVGVVMAVWRRPGPPEEKAAVLLLGAPLLPPYLWFYDCLTASTAVALLAARGWRAGFRPWERLALAAVWAAPLVNLIAAGPTPVPAMTAAGLAAFGVVGANGLLRRRTPAIA